MLALLAAEEGNGYWLPHDINEVIWGTLAFAVGFGGSMIWFGSSAGVALSNLYPEAKSVGRWITQG